jgi:hypothetical protein
MVTVSCHVHARTCLVFELSPLLSAVALCLGPVSIHEKQFNVIKPLILGERNWILFIVTHANMICLICICFFTKTLSQIQSAPLPTVRLNVHLCCFGLVKILKFSVLFYIHSLNCYVFFNW